MYNYYSHFTGEEIEVQRGQAIVLRLSSWVVTVQAWKSVVQHGAHINNNDTIYADDLCLREGEEFHSSLGGRDGRLCACSHSHLWQDKELLSQLTIGSYLDKYSK